MLFLPRLKQSLLVGFLQTNRGSAAHVGDTQLSLSDEMKYNTKLKIITFLEARLS